MATAGNGTHPTGMHSCLSYLLFSEQQITLSRMTNVLIDFSITLHVIELNDVLYYTLLAKLLVL